MNYFPLTQDGSSPLHFAAIVGCVDAVVTLLDKEARISIYNEVWNTFLKIYSISYVTIKYLRKDGFSVLLNWKKKSKLGIFYFINFVT